jgi:hypothetical protein
MSYIIKEREVEFCVILKEFATQFSTLSLRRIESIIGGGGEVEEIVITVIVL